MRPLAWLTVLSVVATPLAAQDYRLDLPWPSPHATVSQVVGLTTLAVDYHRPGVNGRVIWGGLVPYDTVWRAGANENTVLASTSPFTVGGVTLPAGRYGVFIIPGRESWTVALSRQANAWGAFSYTPTEDAVRLVVRPRANEYTERLAYTFDDPTDTGVTLTLRWEKLAVGVPIAINSDRVVLDSLASQLRNLPRFWAGAGEQAAAWALNNTDDVRMAGVWADTAVALRPNFASYNIKAAVLAKEGRLAEADSLRQAHLATATEPQLNAYGYQLLNERRTAEALAIFQRNAAAHPKSWNVWDSLGEGYAVAGEKAKAAESYRKALALAPPAQRQRIEGILAGLK